jgi:hypothetical protein
LALALVLIAGQPGTAHEPKPAKVVSTPRTSVSADADDCTCIVYSLDELGADPDLGAWVAETVPEVVAPGTWKGPGALRYYAPKKILVVYHTPAVQAQVDAFLKKVTHASTTGKDHASAAQRKPMPGRGVVPAAYHTPAELKPPAVAEQSLSYPVPAPVRAPKHLFHFIIRYEGEGIIDDSVVQAIKAYYRAERKEKDDKDGATHATCSAPLPSPTELSGPPSLNSAKPAEPAPEPGQSKKGTKAP